MITTGAAVYSPPVPVDGVSLKENAVMERSSLLRVVKREKKNNRKRNACRFAAKGEGKHDPIIQAINISKRKRVSL